MTPNALEVRLLRRHALKCKCAVDRSHYVSITASLTLLPFLIWLFLWQLLPPYQGQTERNRFKSSIRARASMTNWFHRKRKKEEIKCMCREKHSLCISGNRELVPPEQEKQSSSWSDTPDRHIFPHLDRFKTHKSAGQLWTEPVSLGPSYKTRRPPGLKQELDFILTSKWGIVVNWSCLVMSCSVSAMCWASS